MNIETILSNHSQITDETYILECKSTLDEEGALVLPQFISDTALQMMKEEASAGLSDAYFCASKHNVYLTPSDAKFNHNHPRNREVVSSKGLIGDDQLSNSSPLKHLYLNKQFQSFIAQIVGEDGLYSYADPLSSVNVHYAKEGQELGWHFDNSSFAITLLIDKPEAGGEFQYLKDVRDADAGEYSFDIVGKLLDGDIAPHSLSMEPGTLVLFRGRNSIHRVTPTIGTKTRMLAVLAYNSEPGVSLSESARMTFYGRLS